MYIYVHRFFRDLSCPFWSTVQCGARQSIHTLNYTEPCSQLCHLFNRGCALGGVLEGVCLSCADAPSHMWQHCVSCIRSGVTRCILFMVLFLGRMCKFGLHAVLWSHIGMLIRFLAEEPHSTARVLFSTQCRCGCIRWCWTGGFQD